MSYQHGRLPALCGIPLIEDTRVPERLPVITFDPYYACTWATDEYRAQMNAWLAERFGTQRVAFCFGSGTARRDYRGRIPMPYYDDRIEQEPTMVKYSQVGFINPATLALIQAQAARGSPEYFYRKEYDWSYRHRATQQAWEELSPHARAALERTKNST